MENLFILKIAGPIFLAVGIGFTFNSKYYQQIIKSFVDSTGLTYLAGLFTLFLGLLILQKYNVINYSLNGLSALIGFSCFIKGFLILAFPKYFLAMAERRIKCKKLMKFSAIVMIIFGVLLTYLGYFG